MSRIGKLPIIMPEGVEAKIDGFDVMIKGPKGALTTRLVSPARAVLSDQSVLVSVADPTARKDRALWGLYQRLISNMVIGVTRGYEKKLEINGIGFRAAVTGNKIVLHVGFSHPVEFQLPPGITASVEKNIITVNGIDKQLVGEITAQLRRVRPPEPYKGKGIKYTTEVVRRKAGKQATKK